MAAEELGPLERRPSILVMAAEELGPLNGCSIRRRSGFPYHYGAAGAFQRVLGARRVRAFFGSVRRPDANDRQPDGRNNAHLVLHTVWNVDLSSGSESQKETKKKQSTNRVDCRTSISRSSDPRFEETIASCQHQ